MIRDQINKSPNQLEGNVFNCLEHDSPDKVISRKKKQKTKKIKELKSLSFDQEVCPNTEEEMSNEELEARKSWELGKRLNLTARGEDEVVRELIQLRRSSRRRKKAMS